MTHRKRREPDWRDVWHQVKVVMERHGAPREVLSAVDDIEWEMSEGRIHLYCPEAIYRWMEVPATVGGESNLRFVKPILWPLMQQYGCKDLVYHLY